MRRRSSRVRLNISVGDFLVSWKLIKDIQSVTAFLLIGLRVIHVDVTPQASQSR